MLSWESVFSPIIIIELRASNSAKLNIISYNLCDLHYHTILQGGKFSWGAYFHYFMVNLAVMKSFHPQNVYDCLLHVQCMHTHIHKKWIFNHTENAVSSYMYLHNAQTQLHDHPKPRGITPVLAHTRRHT